MSFFEQITDQVRDSIYALTSCLCSPSASVKLNGRVFKIRKLLGEGGFSYVYLAEDTTSGSGRLFALKKIRCPEGSEAVREAMKEVEAYRRFRHPNIIRCLDSCVVQDKDGEGKIIYLFLPYYKRGTLQDAIAANAVNGARFPEAEMLRLFVGLCHAVRAMHTYRLGRAVETTYPPNSTAESTVSLHVGGKGEDDDDAHGQSNGQYAPLMGNDGPGGHDDGELHEESGNSNIGGLGEYGGRVKGSLDPHPVDDGGEAGKLHPWAHRDIKPGNVMISDEGHPILFDFGSAIPARIPIPNRSVALTQQDIAAEHSSMPFRACELFEVQVGTPLDEKVDIWSLGCTLFALAYGTSPFETNAGDSIVMAVRNGQYKFPANDQVYSQGLKDLISSMLVVDPQKRPDIHEVLKSAEAALARVAP